MIKSYWLLALKRGCTVYMQQHHHSPPKSGTELKCVAAVAAGISRKLAELSGRSSLLHAAPQSAAAAGISGLLPPPSLPVSDPSSSPHKLFIHPSRGSPRCPCREIRKHICRLHVRRGDLHGRARRGRRQFAAAAGSLRHHASSDHICLRRRSFALRHQRPQGAASDFVDSSTASAFFPCLSGLSSSWSGICRHRSSAAT